MKLVVDTNALLLPFRDNTDIVSEAQRLIGNVEWIVPTTVKAELETLSKSHGDGPIGAVQRNAASALRLMALMTVVETDLPGDDGVLEVARRLHAAVLSDDKALLDEAKKSGLRALRSRGHGLTIA